MDRDKATAQMAANVEFRDPQPAERAVALNRHDTVQRPLPPKPGSLSRKLLLVTLAAVMVVEVFVFVPSVANFRKNWLDERLVAGQVASVASELAPDGTIPDDLRDELLATAQVKSIAFRRDNQRRLIVREKMPPTVDRFFDLMQVSRPQLIMDALEVFFASPDRTIAVRGMPRFGHADFVEIVMPEAPLRAAMIDFGLNILALSILISLFAAFFVYLALNAMFVRPMRAMMQNMIRFSEDPEDASRIITPSGRRDEIGRTEFELAEMQGQLRAALQQKSRLASLGLAVSKINHDLRNMLSSAQLISDQFETIEHPTARRFAPKLIGSLDRAIRLCTDTLLYGQAKEQPPHARRFRLRPLVSEVGEGLALPRDGGVGFTCDIPDELQLFADRDQFYRVISNLCRNALQALDSQREDRALNGGVTASSPPAHQEDRISIRAWRENGRVLLDVMDNGPGIPAAQRGTLFQAFQSSARRGGTGLGLAISADLVRAHGGTIALLDESDTLQSASGTVFRISLPDVAN